MPSAAAMSELWRPSTTGRMVRLSLRASAGCGRPAACADTRFEIGSITKTFTALALAQTVVAGRLSLDTRVRGLLPAGGALPSRNGVDITVEHLARHTSGLPRSPRGLSLRAVWPPVRGERIRTRRSARRFCSRS